MEGEDKVGAVLVVGGGIGGMQASLDLAESGFKVYLMDSSPTIGGVMSQLDKTFPTNDCSMCIMSPKLVECGRHLNIEIFTNTRVEDIKGDVGGFEVLITESPRYIDVEKCTGCGLCGQACPVSAVDSYNEALSDRAAIYIEYPQAVPLAYAIDREKCIGCGLCENICLAEAINYAEDERKTVLNVGAIILAPGFEEFDAKLKGEYGYDRYPNVVTSIQFERILSASGPYKGRVQRPSDGEIPRKIAFVQCVGSRDLTCGNNYCSSVCCMYATKEAAIAKEHMNQIEPTIFFMDMRAYGKDFDKYIERAKGEYGVRFIRSRVSSVEEVPETQNLQIAWETEDGRLTQEEFELVVLSVALTPSQEVQETAERLGIELNGYGFCKTSDLSPLETSRPGIFVCGAFSSPKDIPETVIQASGAASQVGSLLSSVRGALVKGKEYPEEMDIRGQGPRIGVFVCHCGINIGGVVNVPQVIEYAKTLPKVVFADGNLYTCSQDAQERIKEKIKEHGLNRVIVASCTPRTHEPLFQETVREAGLNRYLFEMANIRDQCSWVHMHQPVEATEKAKDLVRMAVTKARRLEPLERLPLDITPRGLVIGGGLSGMTAALSLAEQGFEAYLVEKEKKLGGNLRNVYFTLNGDDTQKYLHSMVEKVMKNELIHVYLNTTIEGIGGYVGNFKTTIRLNGTGEDERIELEHGIVIVATGGEELKTDEYLYGKDERVITQMELEKRVAEGDTGISKCGRVVMIQCVGSRCDERPYCSRVCCSEAIKNALQVKEISPETDIFVLYRDMRTYGFKEEGYQKAREAGVIFIRYDEDNRPEVIRENGDLRVVVFEPIIGEEIELSADLLVLSVATVPRSDNRYLAQMLKVPLNDDNLFLEAHMKLRPVDFATEGVFVCGLAHSPKFIDESIAQANAAVSRACTVLSKERIEAEEVVSTVNENRCTGCGTCTLVCAYNAVEIDEQKRVAVVNEALCKGCGACSASCRSGAIDVRGFTDEQILMVVDAL